MDRKRTQVQAVGRSLDVIRKSSFSKLTIFKSLTRHVVRAQLDVLLPTVWVQLAAPDQ